MVAKTKTEPMTLGTMRELGVRGLNVVASRGTHYCCFVKMF
jgi:hypothetical protein